MNAKSTMMMIGFLASMLSPSNAKEKTPNIKVLNKTTPKAKSPKGTKEYFFDQFGDFTTSKNKTVFSCIASNEKNAIRKYKSFKK